MIKFPISHFEGCRLKSVQEFALNMPSNSIQKTIKISSVVATATVALMNAGNSSWCFDYTFMNINHEGKSSSLRIKKKKGDLLGGHLIILEFDIL